MKTKYLFIYICLVLLTAPLGVVKGQGYAKFNLLKSEPQNTFSILCKDAGLDVNKIKGELANIEESLKNAEGNPALKPRVDEIKAKLEIFNTINGTDDPACIEFIKVYKELDIDQILGDINNLNKVSPDSDPINDNPSKIIIDPNHLEDVVKSHENKMSQINQIISELEKKDDASKEGNYNNIVYITALIILFIMMLVLYSKYRKLNKDLKALKSALEYNIRIITDKYNNLNPQTKNHTVEKKRVSEIKTVPPTPNPQVVAQPIEQTTTPQVNNETIIYVTVDATPNVNDKLWKETSERTDQHLYEIHLEKPNSTTGELRICPNIKPEFEKKFIEERQSYFRICDMHSNGTVAPTHIELKKSGQVVKTGNEWRVTIRPLVELK